MLIIIIVTQNKLIWLFTPCYICLDIWRPHLGAGSCNCCKTGVWLCPGREPWRHHWRHSQPPLSKPVQRAWNLYTRLDPCSLITCTVRRSCFENVLFISSVRFPSSIFLLICKNSKYIVLKCNLHKWCLMLENLLYYWKK